MSEAINHLNPATRTKRQTHFVPQMYLRAFVDPGSNQNLLWRYGRGFKPQCKSHKSVGWEDYFYDASAELKPEHNRIEEFYAQAESRAAPHLDKLRAGKIDLTTLERSELSTFIALLFTRTRGYREITNEVWSMFAVLTVQGILNTPGAIEEVIERMDPGERIEVEEFRGGLQALVDGNVTVSQISKGWAMKQALESTQLYDDVLSSMNWNLLKAPIDSPFITSDKPAIISDPTSGPGSNGPSRLVELHFPLSPEYLLAGGYFGQPEQVVSIESAIVDQFNQNQILSAQKEVYASFRSDELQRQVDKMFSEKRLNTPLLKEIIEAALKDYDLPG